MNSKKNVWILSFRLSGNDGVTFEAIRWGNMFKLNGYRVTYVAGELDRRGILIPELHFNTPEIYDLHERIVFGKNSYKEIQKEIFKVAGQIEGLLRDLLSNKKPDLLVVANVFSLPMHFGLSIALTRIIEEYGIKTIARHHDFWWERKRYLRSNMFPFFKKWFPPSLPQVKHVVINSIAKNNLKKRFGFDSVVIPDSFNFESSLNNRLDSFSKNFRKDIGIGKDDIVFLQATRIVPRKRIELSIELLEKLNNPNYVLIVAGHSGDEGIAYENNLSELAAKSKARVIFIGDRVDSRRKITVSGNRIYTLWDCFMNADFMVYPSEVEGFGNQFIEAVYFKKPVILTEYPVFRSDIKPLGFGYIGFNDKNLKQKLINKKYLKDLVDKNFKLGQKHFSYNATWKKIRKLI